MRKQRRSSAAQLISAFVYATRIVLSIYFLNLKFQAPSNLLWLYSPVCVGPGRKPEAQIKIESYNELRAYSNTCNSLLRLKCKSMPKLGCFLTFRGPMEGSENGKDKDKNSARLSETIRYTQICNIR